MKWMSRQLSLPILVTFSLTGVSMALLYLVYKKEQEVKDTQQKNAKNKLLIEKQVKIPRQLVPLVIGKGGSTMTRIQIKTDTKIRFEKDDIEFPYRTCIIKGKESNIQQAEELIQNTIANQPIIETYEFFIPQKAFNKVVGRAEESLHYIQMTSSAKIIIDNTYLPRDPDAERRVIIKGTAEQIANALSQIEDKVREDREARMKMEASAAARQPRGKLSPHSTAVNISDQPPNTESLSAQSSTGSMEVYVSAMNDPSQFWVQIVGPGSYALDKLVSQMTEYYNEEENREFHILKNVSVGQIVASRFSFDGEWYRAEVVSAPEDGTCEVFFLDYGDREVVQVSNLFELRTDFLSLRPQAVECCLANVLPRENEWSAEACDRFDELVGLAQWKILVAKVRGYKDRAPGAQKPRRDALPIPCVDLYDKSDRKAKIDVGLELVNDGLANLEEPLLSAASSTLSLSVHSNEFLVASSPLSTSPLPERAVTPSKTDIKFVQKEIEEIDLTTPKKVVEEIDLVTPAKDRTMRLIESERRGHHENGSGDYIRNGSNGGFQPPSSRNSKKVSTANILPADFESDVSGDEDDLELG